MSDEPKSNDKPDGSWVMPEPVYRSSPGRPPKGVHQTDVVDEIPTEPGFHDAPTLETEGLPPDVNQDDIATEPGFHSAPTVETEGLPPEKDQDNVPTEKPVNVKPPEPRPKKKRGCARSFLTVVSVIALAVIGVVIAVVYFLFYYKSADSTF